MLDGRSMPVLTGPSRGNRIVVGTGNHAYWIGHFEQWKQSFIAGNLAEGSVFYDLGAHVGFFTLLGAKLVGATGKVISVEPMPANIARLRAHIQINGYGDRVRVIEAAASVRSGVARFTAHGESSMAHLDDQGDTSVATVALDELHLDPPSLVKMDIEGGEPAALIGMKNLISAGRPAMVISPHGTEDQCVALLEDWGYSLETVGSDFIALPKDRPRPLKGLRT
jgi:FkbM family methyltransferase